MYRRIPKLADRNGRALARTDSGIYFEMHKLKSEEEGLEKNLAFLAQRIQLLENRRKEINQRLDQLKKILEMRGSRLHNQTRQGFSDVPGSSGTILEY